MRSLPPPPPLRSGQGISVRQPSLDPFRPASSRPGPWRLGLALILRQPPFARDPSRGHYDRLLTPMETTCDLRVGVSLIPILLRTSGRNKIIVAAFGGSGCVHGVAFL